MEIGETERLMGIVSVAIKDLSAANKELANNIRPHVPLPRPKIFFIPPGYSWPYRGDWEHIWDNGKGGGLYLGFPTACAERICSAAGYQPRKILAALRQIQAATAWCKARTEGRKRMAQEILKQQAAAVEALEAEAAIAALK